MTDLADSADMPAPLAAALVDALAELTDIVRTRVADAGSYQYRFAGLSDVHAVVRPVLAAHGLATRPLVETIPFGNGVTVEARTQIIHTSGATDTSPAIRLVVPSTDAQRVGSAITYARRYSLTSALGIAGDDDDDGHHATAPTPAPATRSVNATRGRSSATANAGAKGTTPEQAKAYALLDTVSPDVRTQIHTAFRKHFGVTLRNLDRDRHAEALSFVQLQVPIPDDPEFDVDPPGES